MAACGAGLESMHESDFRFEHCYRLDMDTKIAPSHRYHCWVDWTQTYAYGQSRDRVEYARRRILTLEAGDASLVTVYGTPTRRERVFSVVGGPEPENAPMAAPAPTSTSKPPPATAPEMPPAAGTAPSSASSAERPERPGAACANECETLWKTCQDACGNPDACTGCREDYRNCMERCFR